MLRRSLGITVIATLALLSAAGSAAAKKFEVNTTADHRPGACTKSDCTLREAIIRANEHSGPDKVLLPASDDPYALTRPGSGEDEAARAT